MSETPLQPRDSAESAPLLPISGDRFGQLLLGAVRYALGRASYVVADTIDTIQIVWPELSATWRQLVERDVREAVELAEHRSEQEGRPIRVGHQGDHDRWVTLLDWIDEQPLTDIEYDRIDGHA